MTDLEKIVHRAICSYFGVDTDVPPGKTTIAVQLASGVAREIEKAGEIDTVEALDALPIPALGKLSGTLIRATGVPAFGEVYERNTDGTWCLLQDPSGADRGQRLVPSEDIPLPAHILWMPSS